MQALPNWEILRSEDNTADIRLTQQNLHFSQSKNQLQTARDEQAALQYLSQIFTDHMQIQPDLNLHDKPVVSAGFSDFIKSTRSIWLETAF